VRAALDKYRADGAPDLMGRAEAIAGHAGESLPGRFRRFGALTIIGAGLLDGINPCAFATLVFFIGYLSYTGSRGGSILKVGLLFAAGVFLAYFAFGLGILHAVLAMDSFPAIRRVAHGVLGVACLVLAALSVQDFRRARAGDFSAMKLQLPGLLKRQVHSAVRGGVRGRYLGPMAFAAGATVSALEFACTGQVYIPAITYMASLSDARAAAVSWLVVYDAMFIVPLLALLGLAYSGVSSKRLAEFAEGRASSTKLLLAAFFALAAAFFLIKASGLV
jgi:cytochrome c biogenesis protein CcdA